MPAPYADRQRSALRAAPPTAHTDRDAGEQIRRTQHTQYEASWYIDGFSDKRAEKQKHVRDTRSRPQHWQVTFSGLTFQGMKLIQFRRHGAVAASPKYENNLADDRFELELLPQPHH